MAAPRDLPSAAPARSQRWQDWLILILAVWLFISPWVLQFGAHVSTVPPAPADNAAPVVVSNLGQAAWNAWILGVIVFLLGLSVLGRMTLRQEWIIALLGIWIFIAPWVLGFAGAANAAWDHWIVGFLIFVISIWTVTSARRAVVGTGP